MSGPKLKVVASSVSAGCHLTRLSHTLTWMWKPAGTKRRPKADRSAGGTRACEGAESRVWTLRSEKLFTAAGREAVSGQGCEGTDGPTSKQNIICTNLLSIVCHTWLESSCRSTAVHRDGTDRQRRRKDAAWEYKVVWTPAVQVHLWRTALHKKKKKLAFCLKCSLLLCTHRQLPTCCMYNVLFRWKLMMPLQDDVPSKHTQSAIAVLPDWRRPGPTFLFAYNKVLTQIYPSKIKTLAHLLSCQANKSSKVMNWITFFLFFLPVFFLFF